MLAGAQHAIPTQFATVRSACIILVSGLGLFACNQDRPAGTLNYRELHFDTGRIAIFSWDTALTIFPVNSDPVPISNSDLLLVDSLVTTRIKQFNVEQSPGLYEAFGRVFPLDSFVIHVQKYKFQYFPYKDVNGQKIILVDGFKRPFSKWRQEPYVGKLHEGIVSFDIKINLSDTTATELATPGYG